MDQVLKEENLSIGTIPWGYFQKTAQELADNLVLKELDGRNRGEWERIFRNLFLTSGVFNQLQELGLEVKLEDLGFQEIVDIFQKYPQLFEEENVLEGAVPSKELADLLEELKEHEKSQTSVTKKSSSPRTPPLIQKTEQKEVEPPEIETMVREVKARMETGITEEGKRQKVAEVIVQVVKAEKIARDWQRVSQLSTEDETQKSAAREIQQQIKDSYQKEAVPAIIEELKKRNVQLNSEEIATLATINPFFPEKPSRELPVYERKVTSWISAQLKPIESTQKQTVAENLTRAVLGSSVNDLNVPLGQAKENIEKIVLAALAQRAEDYELEPAQVEVIINAFVPGNREEQKKLVSLAEKFQTVKKIPSSTELSTTVEEVGQLPPLYTFNGNLLQVKTEKGEVLEPLVEEIHQRGIKKENALLIKREIQTLIIFGLVHVDQVTPQDIAYTRQQLEKKGVSPTAPVILKLKNLEKEVFEHLEKLPPAEQARIAAISQKRGQKGDRFVKIGAEEIYIVRQTRPQTGLFATFSRKIFGTVSVPLNRFQSIIVNRFSLIRQNFFNAVKSRFFQTAFGQTIKSSLERAGQKGLQTLFSSIQRKIGGQFIKTAVTSGLKSLVTKLGSNLVIKGVFQAVGSAVPVIGNIVAGLVSHIVTKWLPSILEKVKGGLLAIFNPDPRSNKSPFWAVAALGGTLTLALSIVGGTVLLGGFLLLKSETGTYVMTGQGGLTEELPGNPLFPSSEIKCDKTRDLAETIICLLAKRPSPCDNQTIDETTWNEVKTCFARPDTILPNKGSIMAAFEAHLLPIDNGKRNLQCVGFAVGSEAGRGHNLVSYNARDYLTKNVSGYKVLPSDSSNFKVGDMAVWKGTRYGHIAVIIEKREASKTIIIADANGYTGDLGIWEVPYGEIKEGSPDGFLQKE